MNKFLFLFAFMMGCHGSCSPEDAMRKELGPGADCFAGDNNVRRGFCVKQNVLYGCNFVGFFTHDAECVPMGLINYVHPKSDSEITQ